jgi:hypothetical protein
MQTVTKPVAGMTRDEMVTALMWSSGGSGWGVTPIGSQLIARMSRKELPSIVTVQGSPTDYTDEELLKLVQFSQERTARAHKALGGPVLHGDNLYVLKKNESNWLAKRQTWTHGPMHAPTLDEAISFLSGN